jgi:EAL domain-containing protein (putative c-di-GMP-specific phosphodiesterase class I)
MGIVVSSQRPTPDALPPPPASSATPRAHPPTPNEENFGTLARGTDPALQPVARTNTDELRDLEARLGRCMSTLTMHYQPIVHAATRARFGYEALLRTTDKSLPHPGAILDAAERLEKIPVLGRAVRAQVARTISEAPPERGVVFVNLHLLDLFDKQLSSAFAPLTKVSSRVVLEITERTSLEGQADVRYRVQELRELGFKIAIDDLGGGHARMGTFSPLDFDFVKLDMSLVRDMDKHPMKQRLVRSITELCREHNTKVIGEGVETEAEAKALIDLGCDLLQGYLIAKPALPFVDSL